MSVTATLAREHDVLRELLDRLERTLRWKLAADLEPTLRLLQHHLALHWEREECLLYPALAPVLGRDEGPVVHMLDEHCDGRGRLESILALGAQGIEDSAVRDAMLRAGATWIAHLRAHFDKEEKLVFPLADRLLPVSEREELAAGLGNGSLFPSLRELVEDRTEESWKDGTSTIVGDR